MIRWSFLKAGRSSHPCTSGNECGRGHRWALGWANDELWSLFLGGWNAAFREADCSQIKMITVTIMKIIIIIIFLMYISSRCYSLLCLYSLYMHLSRKKKRICKLLVSLKIIGHKHVAWGCLRWSRQVESLRSAVAASCVVYPQMEGFIWGYYPQFNLDEHPCEVCRVSFMTNKFWWPPEIAGKFWIDFCIGDSYETCEAKNCCGYTLLTGWNKGKWRFIGILS